MTGEAVKGTRVVVSAPGPLEGCTGTITGTLGQVGAVWDEWVFLKLDGGSTVKLHPWLVRPAA